MLTAKGCCKIGKKRGSRGPGPLAEREVSSPFPISLPPQAAKKNFAPAQTNR